MDEREMECKKERIFENTYVAVNVKTKKILLSMKVTDEHVHDSKQLPELINGVIKLESMTTTTTSKLFADGAYDSINFFRCLIDNGILPCIKVRKNAKIRWKKGNIIRNLATISQRKKDLQKWKAAA